MNEDGLRFNLRKSIRQQICTLIKEKLQRGSYQMPSELALAQELGVSRATIREVLSELAGEGWIFRRHGNGTFINPTLTKRQTPMMPMPYFLDIIAGYGKEPSIQFVNYSLIRDCKEAAEQLLLSPEQEIVRITFAYRADGEVCIICHDYFDARLIDPETFAPMKQCSIFQMLYEIAGCVVVWANTELSAVDTLRAPQVGQLMQVVSGDFKPLLLVSNTCYDTEDRPVFYSESFFDTDLIKFGYVQQYGTGRKMDVPSQPFKVI